MRPTVGQPTNPLQARPLPHRNHAQTEAQLGQDLVSPENRLQRAIATFQIR